jgi:hypothetical protein
LLRMMESDLYCVRSSCCKTPALNKLKFRHHR